MNSAELDKIQDKIMVEYGILVTFDVFLFNRVSIGWNLRITENALPPSISELFQYILSTTYNQFQGEFYEQTDGVSIVNFYIKDFEEKL